MFSSTRTDANHEHLGKDDRMRFLLSFAVGAILGDIFFHLIPESIHSHTIELNLTPQVASKQVGISIIAGIFMFIIVEIILEKWSNSIENKESAIKNSEVKIDTRKSQNEIIKDLKSTKANKFVEDNNNCEDDLNRNAMFRHQMINHNSPEYLLNNDCTKLSRRKLIENKPASIEEEQEDQKSKTDEQRQIPVDVAGYLSLIANGFDNFTHGLAIGASFLVGFKIGMLTTFVIFLHEIPHEICDYAILVNSGFTRWDAVKAQSSVSLFGILGTALALYVKSFETLQAKTVWILPFSAGGFLYIALVNLLPEMLNLDVEKRNKNSLGQIISLLLGIAIMAMIAVI